MPTYTIPELARNALIHAREFLLDGSTRLENNNYSNYHKNLLSSRMSCIFEHEKRK